MVNYITTGGYMTGHGVQVGDYITMDDGEVRRIVEINGATLTTDSKWYYKYTLRLKTVARFVGSIAGKLVNFLIERYKK